MSARFIVAERPMYHWLPDGGPRNKYLRHALSRLGPDVLYAVDRAAFALSSPDEPAKQKKFAESRGWRFPVVSHSGTSFAKDMGFAGDDGFYPGVSVFTRKDGKILRVSDDSFSPGDDYSSIWHLFELIPGKSEWEPRYTY